LFTTNGYLLLVNGWFGSFKVVPISGLAVSDVEKVLTKNLGQFFLASVEVAAPVLGCLFLAEVLLGVLSRAAPQLNIFSLAFPVRVVVALVVVGLAIPLIAPAVGNLVRQAVAPLGAG
jgi:flagellar biosynthetic protein FliR